MNTFHKVLHPSIEALHPFLNNVSESRGAKNDRKCWSGWDLLPRPHSDTPIHLKAAKCWACVCVWSEVKSRLGLCGAKAWQAVVFTPCLCDSFASLGSFSSTEEGQEALQPCWGGCVLSGCSPWHETSRRPVTCWRRDVNAPLHTWKIS